MILGIKTDQPDAVLLLSDGEETFEITWQGHRQLSDTIFIKLDELLIQAQVSFNDITGIVVFEGPGSFTGLRIGITVANTLSYSLQKPIVAAGREDWFKNGTKLLSDGKNHKIAKPVYGGEANITKPRK